LLTVGEEATTSVITTGATVDIVFSAAATMSGIGCFIRGTGREGTCMS